MPTDNLKPKCGHHTGGKWFILGLQTQQGESAAKTEIPLLIILVMVCKSHIEEIRGNLFNLFIRKDSPLPDVTLGGGYVFYTLIISYWVNIANILYGTTSVQKE